MGMASFTTGCFSCTTKRNEEQLTFMLQAFVEMPPLQIGVKVLVLLLKNAVLIWNNECMNDFLSPILSGISFIEQAVTPKKYL